VSDDAEELKIPLLIDKGKIDKGTLRGFVVVDPTWVSPVNYNSTNPLKPDFFIPSSWYVMGKLVHASRLLHLHLAPGARHPEGGIQLRRDEHEPDGQAIRRQLVAHPAERVGPAALVHDVRAADEACSALAAKRDRA
jgi:hypothetical protein